MTETLQEKYIRELLDPRSALTPRENAAAGEILLLRAEIEKLQNQKADKGVVKNQRGADTGSKG